MSTCSWETSVRGLVAAVKIHCEFLAPDGWQVEGKRCSVGHGGCGVGLIRDATRLEHRFCYANRGLVSPPPQEFFMPDA